MPKPLALSLTVTESEHIDPRCKCNPQTCKQFDATLTASGLSREELHPQYYNMMYEVIAQLIALDQTTSPQPLSPLDWADFFLHSVNHLFPED